MCALVEHALTLVAPAGVQRQCEDMRACKILTLRCVLGTFPFKTYKLLYYGIGGMFKKVTFWRESVYTHHCDMFFEGGQSIATCFLREIRGGVVVFVLLEVSLHCVLLLS